jgi:N-acetylglucosamine-6-sulfatase
MPTHHRLCSWTQPLRRVAIVLSLFTVAVVGPLGAGEAEAAARRYNIVIVLADDQRWDMVRPDFTPMIWSRLGEQGMRFTNAFVPNALCCPSRASILTGNHSHTTGVWSNQLPYGGFRRFDDRHTIAIDFDRAGYRTAMIGKYLNGYPAGWTRYVPPGWDEWFAVRSAVYYDYAVTTDSGFRRFGSRPRDYISRVLSHRARSFVLDARRRGRRFFLFYSFTAPHKPAIPDPRDVERFGWVTTSDTGTPDVHRRMLEAAYGVDRAVGALLDVLPAHTIVVYLSDNGYLWGEHGETGKVRPWNESIRIPLIMRSLDGGYRTVARPDDLVLNIDLRPTLTRAGPVLMLTTADGRNWNGTTYRARSRFPIEHYGDDSSGVSSFCGVRQLGWMYTRYAGGREILFDTAADPHEEVNLAGQPDFASEQDRLRAAAKATCDPPPPGYRW